MEMKEEQGDEKAQQRKEKTTSGYLYQKAHKKIERERWDKSCKIVDERAEK